MHQPSLRHFGIHSWSSSTMLLQCQLTCPQRVRNKRVSDSYSLSDIWVLRVNNIYVSYECVCTRAHRQRLRGSRKEKMYRQRALGSMQVKSAACRGSRLLTLRLRNTSCSEEQLSTKSCSTAFLWLSDHLSNWQTRCQRNERTVSSDRHRFICHSELAVQWRTIRASSVFFIHLL